MPRVRQPKPRKPVAAVPPPPPAPEPVAMPTAPPPPPAFDPNYIDAQGQSDLSGLTTSTERRKADASRAYARSLAATAAQRPGIERNRVMGIDHTQSNAAARGMFRSGNRIVGEGRVNTDANEQNAALTRQDTQAFEDSDTETSRANEDYTLGRQGIYSQAGQRRLDQYRQQWGV